MIERNGIAVAGSVLVDKINEIKAYPQSGELTQIVGLEKAVGGCAVSYFFTHTDPYSVSLGSIFHNIHDHIFIRVRFAAPINRQKLVIFFQRF